MIHYFLKSALRNLLQNKVYASISIIGFSISFAICIVIALYVKYENDYDKCFTDHDNIFRIIDHSGDRNRSRFDYDVNKLFTEKIPEVKNACPLFMHIGWKNTVKSGDQNIYFDELICTTNKFFQIFNIKDIHGNPVSFMGSKNHVVITASLADQLFPNEEAKGKSIKIMDEYDMNVAYVIPDFPEHSSFMGQIIMNSQSPDYRFSTACNNGDCYNPSEHFVLLDHTSKAHIVETKINDMFDIEKTRVERVTLQPLTEIHLDNKVDGSRHKLGNKSFINILVIIGFLILIISVINYVNFTNSLQFTRLKVVGIQKTIGAQGKQLFLYQFTEVMLWISIATIISMGMGYIGMPYFSNLFEANLSFVSIFSPIILLVISLVFISVIIIASVGPLVILFKGKVAVLLKNTISKSGKAGGKTVLTSFQLVISIVLVVGILMIQKQIRYAKHKDLGFEKEQMLMVNSPNYFRNHEALKNELLKHSSISALSYTHGGPGNIFMGMGNGEKGENYFNLKCISVDSAFINTFGIELILGRDFMPSDYEKACIMNREAYKQYGWKDLENKRFMNGREGGYEVVGVVEDFHIASLYEEITPVCLIYNVNRTSYVNMRLAGGDIGGTMDYIEKTWKEISGNLPFEYQFYDTFFDSMYKKEETLSHNVSLFAFIALVLTVLGIFGQIFHMSIVKTKEIGVRKVNGAKVFEILAMLNSDFFRWVAMAFLIATPIAWYVMKQWLSSFFYKTTMDWWIFALSGLIVLSIALLTVSWQSWMAARRNPVEALRYE